MWGAYEEEAGVNASRSLMDKVRDNPIPAAMVVIGLFLMMRGSGRGDGYEVEFIPDDTGWDSTGARAEPRDIFRDHPLIAGLAALAAGAILGALIPETEREHELMGDVRQRLAERARAAVSGIGTNPRF